MRGPDKVHFFHFFFNFKGRRVVVNPMNGTTGEFVMRTI